MSRYPNITVGQRFELDGRDFKFTGACDGSNGDASEAFDLKFEDARTGRPLLLSAAEFDRRYDKGEVRWLLRAERPTDVPPDADDKDFPKARMRREYCQAYDAAPTSKSTPALAALIERTKSTLDFPHQPPSAGSLRRWLQLRGEPGDRRLRFMRDRIRRGPGAMRIDPIAQKVLAEKAAAYYDGVSVNQHAVYCAVRCEIADLNAKRRAEGLQAISPPSKATVHRYLNQHLDYGNARGRLGDRVGGRPFRAIKGSMKTDRILQVAIMDNTIVDVPVIDDEQGACVGRPTLTLLIDAHSRYPLGFYLGFEPPSISSAMACMRHALRSKRYVSTEYPDIEGEWVAYGVPETIVVDNAWEFTSTSFVDACQDECIHVKFAPVATPEYKGIGERPFGTLNDMLFHRLPGGLPYTPQKRKEIGIDAERDAALTLSELRRLIHQCIIEVYGRSFHKGIKAAPEEVWRKQADRHGRYARDLAAFDLAMARLAPERTLSRDGITLNNLTYRDTIALPALLADLLPRAAKRGVRAGTAKVKVKYHPEDLGQIYVWNQVQQMFVTLPCTEPKYAKGLSEYQHRRIQECVKERDLEFQTEDQRCRARVRLQEEIRALVPVSKIRDRRRAQRMLSSILEPGDQVVVREIQVSESGIPMAGPSIRKNGDKPRRGPSAPAAKRRRSQREAAPSKSPSAPLAVLTSSENLFDDTDFAQLRAESRQLIETGE